MAGTIPLSLTQQIDKDTLRPLSGGKLYLFAAGTTTPQNAYSDTALTLPLPNPITLDAAGRLPQFFLADGQIKVRLTNNEGVTQLAADNLLVIGPSDGGGGGGGTVDATTVLTTGDVKVRYGTGVLSGFVRMNGRTIGSASSGSTERANADTQSLFEYLWNTDANLSVSTGRGVSSLADWTANKTIALPDARGRVLASLDDMGSTASGRITASYFGSTPTVLGAVGGAQLQGLLAVNLPPHAHAGTTSVESAEHHHAFNGPSTKGGTAVVTDGVPNFDFWRGNASENTGVESSTHTHSFTTDGGPGITQAFGILNPAILVTSYIKL